MSEVSGGVCRQLEETEGGARLGPQGLVGQAFPEEVGESRYPGGKGRRKVKATGVSDAKAAITQGGTGR
jgi:hypothetical protein